MLFETFRKISKGTSALKFSVKLLPANMWLVNYSVLKFFPDFQNTEKLSRGALQVATSINAVMKYLNFRRSTSKLESITCKFTNTKSRTPSEVVFEEFHYKCRTTILKNASMAASGDNFIFEIFLNGCFSKTAAKIYLFQKFQVTHVLHFLL